MPVKRGGVCVICVNTCVCMGFGVCSAAGIRVYQCCGMGLNY